MAVSEQEMKDMPLNTRITIGVIDIQRVVGGWIYWQRSSGSSEIEKVSTSTSIAVAGVFVPEKVSSPASIS